MPVVRRYTPYTSDVAATFLVNTGAAFLHGHIAKNHHGKHSILRLEDSNGNKVWEEDLEGQGVAHIHGAQGFRSNTDGTLKIFAIVWPEGRTGSSRQRILIESGVWLDRPIIYGG